MKKLIVKFPNDVEYEQLKIDAHQHNCNLSDYIRHLVAKERKEMEEQAEIEKSFYESEKDFENS